MDHLKSCLILITFFTLIAHTPAQVTPYGYKDFNFTNSTGFGSSSLNARVYYPATTTGNSTPLVTRTGGHPVVVFLHGYATPGTNYFTLGRHLARHGYVTVLSNSALYTAATQVHDGKALFLALKKCNQEANHFLKDALDMDRCGLSGHSMGGGSTISILASNPGYRAGFCFAPLNPGNIYSAQVKVPLFMLHGEGDGVLNWSTNSNSIFQAATMCRDFKALYLFNTQCTHDNLTGTYLYGQTNIEIWHRSADLLTGFLDRFIQGQTRGLERAIGPTARAEPRLTSLFLQINKTELWTADSQSPGKNARLTLLGNKGVALLLTAMGTSNINTPFGILRLDPITTYPLAIGDPGTSQLFSTSLPIPNLTSIVGIKLPFQGVGLDLAQMPHLTGLCHLEITK